MEMQKGKGKTKTKQKERKEGRGSERYTETRQKGMEEGKKEIKRKRKLNGSTSRHAQCSLQYARPTCLQIATNTRLRDFDTQGSHTH